MKYSWPLTILSLSFVVFILSCEKDENNDPPQQIADVYGCTDTLCFNFDPEANIDDMSCWCDTNSQEVNIVLSGSVGTRTLHPDSGTYILNGFVHVDEGDVLTIEAGTVIKGMNGSGADASALIVARGGRIMAEGTADNPIIFTSINDDLAGSLDETITGEWGGVIILGNAVLNTSNTEQNVEGIPTTEAYAKYGGNNDLDNSGVFKYVSIRHGGTNIGEGNEINGLTLAGVGAETVIEHVEIYACSDDGIEFFGGAANVKWAVTAYCGDDSYDYDQGWRGKGQFWVTVHGGDRGGEHDGGTNPENGTPYAKPTIYNATYVGIGIEAGKRAITFRDNAGGYYNNSIFVGYGKGVDIEDLTAENGSDSWERFEMGDLALSGNIFWNTQQADGAATAADLFVVNAPGGFDTPADSTSRIAALVASFAANGNSVKNPGVSAQGTIDLSPDGAVVSGATSAPDSWFTPVTYVGAIDPSTTNWLTGWTRVSTKF